MVSPFSEENLSGLRDFWRVLRALKKLVGVEVGGVFIRAVDGKRQVLQIIELWVCKYPLIALRK